jgi:Domain of unknown function (DUF4252)
MKHLLFCLFLSVCIFPLAAQDGAIYWKYKDYNDSKSFTIPGFVPKFASIFVKGKAERRLVRRTGRTRIMFFENNSPITPTDFVKLTKRTKRRGGLEDIITVKTGLTNIRVMAKENGKRIRKLVFLVQDEGEFVMVSVKGRFRYKDLNTLIKKYSKETEKKKGKVKGKVKIPVIGV